MKNQFKPGDEVVCVDSPKGSLLIEGNVYSVTDCNTEYVFISGLNEGFYHHRFELYNPDKKISDVVNHPQHYGGESNPFEPIKIIEHYNLNFNTGNVIKYVLRAGKKENETADLEKALWYISREVERLKKEGGE